MPSAGRRGHGGNGRLPMGHGSHSGAGLEFLFDIVGKVTSAVESPDICHGSLVGLEAFRSPFHKMCRIIRPDSLQVGTHIQAEIIRHATIGLSASQTPGTGNGQAISGQPFRQEMKRERSGAEAATNDTDGA